MSAPTPATSPKRRVGWLTAVLVTAALVPLGLGTIVARGGGGGTEVRGTQFVQNGWVRCQADGVQVPHPRSWHASADCSTLAPDGHEGEPPVRLRFHHGNYEDITASAPARTRVGDGNDPPSTVLDADSVEQDRGALREQDWIETRDALVEVSLYAVPGLDDAEMKQVYDGIVRRIRSQASGAGAR